MRDEEEIDARAVRDGEEIGVVGYGNRMVEIRWLRLGVFVICVCYTTTTDFF